ncbi:gp436 family protein [Gilliamella sp. CG22]|uniref:gp436 family protein n=1 Tax=Gilliamella sp. CG22 TaxID=3351504 RepID=UPI0039877606
MAYATVQDVYSRYSKTVINQLADSKIDIDEATGEPLQTREQIISNAILDASAAIDGYISGRVSLPIDKIPAVLVRAACVLAYYNLADNVATEKAEKDKDDIIRFLEKVAAGQISLGLSIDNSKLDEVGEVAVITSAGSVWARGRSRGFI